jgi:hypothetical protein
MAATVTLVTATGSAGLLVTVAPGSRVTLQNQGAQNAWIGIGSGVTAANGLLLVPNATFSELECSGGAGDSWYVISTSGTTIAVVTGV